MQIIFCGLMFKYSTKHLNLTIAQCDSTMNVANTPEKFFNIEEKCQMHVISNISNSFLTLKVQINITHESVKEMKGRYFVTWTFWVMGESMYTKKSQFCLLYVYAKVHVAL